MAWSTSTRAQRLPKGWATLRRTILTRDHHTCQAITHTPDCDGRATEVDHIIPGDDHRPENLQALSTPCHLTKTRAEDTARRQAYRAASRRPAEPHPGRITP